MRPRGRRAGRNDGGTHVLLVHLAVLEDDGHDAARIVAPALADDAVEHAALEAPAHAFKLDGVARARVAPSLHFGEDLRPEARGSRVVLCSQERTVARDEVGRGRGRREGRRRVKDAPVELEGRREVVHDLVDRDGRRLGLGERRRRAVDGGQDREDDLGCLGVEPVRRGLDDELREGERERAVEAASAPAAGGSTRASANNAHLVAHHQAKLVKVDVEVGGRVDLVGLIGQAGRARGLAADLLLRLGVPGGGRTEYGGRGVSDGRPAGASEGTKGGVRTSSAAARASSPTTRRGSRRS